MIYVFQSDGWLLDWLKQAFTPGVALAFVAVAVLTWRATTDYGRLGRLENDLHEMRASMVTKGDLHLTIQEMGERLKNWAEARFLTRQELELLKADAERTHERQDADIKVLFERTRSSDSR